MFTPEQAREASRKGLEVRRSKAFNKAVEEGTGTTLTDKERKTELSLLYQFREAEAVHQREKKRIDYLYKRHLKRLVWIDWALLIVISIWGGCMLMSAFYLAQTLHFK
jgi:hypothetical protein